MRRGQPEPASSPLTRDDITTAWALVTSMVRNSTDPDAIAADYAALLTDVVPQNIPAALIMIASELVKAWVDTMARTRDETIPLVAKHAIAMFVADGTVAHGVLMETFMATIREALEPTLRETSIEGITEQMAVVFAGLPDIIGEDA